MIGVGRVHTAVHGALHTLLVAPLNVVIEILLLGVIPIATWPGAFDPSGLVNMSYVDF